MPETTFSLHSYRGPAQINGVDFTEVHVSEHADSEGIDIVRSWQGTAVVSRKNAPTVTPEWLNALLESMRPVEVRLPEGGTGQAYLTDASLTHDGTLEYWRIGFTGTGPSPWMEERREAVCAWLQANGIDPKTVPLHDHQLRITERDGRRFIEYTEFVRDELTGNILADPGNPQPVTSEACVPCLVEPEPWLGVPRQRP